MTVPVALLARRSSLAHSVALGLFFSATILPIGCNGTIGDTPDPTSSTNSGAGGAGDPAGVGGAGDPASSSSVTGSTGSGAGGEGGGAVWQPVETDWCAEGWTGLDDHTCFYVPGTVTTPTSVLFFLHGMTPPEDTPKSLQNLARDAADEHGFIAVFPRGRQGLCAWDASVEEWWCWPTSRTTVDANAASILDEWTAAQSLLEVILDVTFDRRYVLGFSNGGYFASYIGLEGLLETDGIGAVGAGRSNIDESLMPAKSTPFYIAVGDQELQSTQDSAQNLVFVLNKHGWPNDFVIHPGQGHSVGASDFNGACSIWDF
jgi:predicted esterase